MESEEQNKKSIWVFAVASFLNDVGYYLVTVIWPVFVTVTLGASTAFLGFIDGFGDALASISQSLSGFLSDKLKKRKIFIWLGYLSASLSRFIYAASYVPWQVIPGKILDRGGKLRDAPRDAMVADIKKYEVRATAFGSLRAADRSGALLGLIASLFLITALTQRQLFLIAALPSLIGAVLIFIFIHEKNPKTDEKEKLSFSLRLASKNLKFFTVASAIFTLGAFTDSFYILSAKTVGFSLEDITLLYGIFILVSAVSAVPFGKLADKIGRKIVLLSAYLLFIVTNFFFAVANSFWMFLLGFLIYGLHYGAYEGNLKTMVADMSPKEFRASFMGSFSTVMGLIALPASVIAGFLWQTVEFRAPFVFSILLSVISLVVISFMKEGGREIRT